jgi:hypothetical protein
VVSQGDRRGDVELVRDDADTVDPAVVDSVDLRHVTVTRQRDGLRVVIRVEHVRPIHSRWA